MKVPAGSPHTAPMLLILLWLAALATAARAEPCEPSLYSAANETCAPAFGRWPVEVDAWMTPSGRPSLTDWSGTTAGVVYTYAWPECTLLDHHHFSVDAAGVWQHVHTEQRCADAPAVPNQLYWVKPQSVFPPWAETSTGPLVRFFAAALALVLARTWAILRTLDDDDDPPIAAAAAPDTFLSMVEDERRIEK